MLSVNLTKGNIKLGFIILFFITSTYVFAQSGASRTSLYLDLLKSKKVGVVANQTSVINTTHLVDTLLSLNINITKIFTPEHGFRGGYSAGEKIQDGLDLKTGIPLISLYGANKKPTEENLNEIDIMLFDIQDIGVRFYTYISTLHYVMEACAEKNISLILLDRPNPNRHYIDGPVLKKEFKSFVGMHPVPIVYGMTIGEYGLMINGERWLLNGIDCHLEVIPLEPGFNFFDYQLPIKPSPNLPNDRAINLYPSLCLFEGTNVSVGRGTSMPFQIYGAPYFSDSLFQFIPEPNAGAKNPKYNGINCFGFDLSRHKILRELNLEFIINAFDDCAEKDDFFNSFFNKLTGNDLLQKQIKEGATQDQIKMSWQKDLQEFKRTREKYLIYP